MKKKIVIFGCQKITFDLINFLLKKKNVELSLVVTYELPHDFINSGVDIIKLCKKKKIKTKICKKIDKNIEDIIKNIGPDLIISSYYRKILSKPIWSASKILSINIHPSILPFYRGPVPTAWALINMERYTGVTIHKINQTIDGGDILFQKKFKIRKSETGYELYLKSMNEGFYLFKKNFNKLLNNKIKSYKQKLGGSYYGPRNDFDFINWRKKSEEIDALVRMRSYPFNTAQTIMHNRYFFINSVKILNKKILVQKPGKILKVNKDGTFIVSTSNGSILVKDYTVVPKFKNIYEKKIYIKKDSSFRWKM